MGELMLQGTSNLWPARRTQAHVASFAIPAATVVLLVIVQYLFTNAALWRLHYEELAESVRNPYWFSERTLYDQWSSNIGWNGLLCAIYSLIGFDIFTAKWVRFVLHAGSLSCLAVLFIRWQGPFRGSGLLAAVGLSSTWLYYNTYQTSNGIDLQFVPPVLCILLVMGKRPPRWEQRAFWCGLLVSFAALCYPTAIFYLPFCLLVGMYQVWNTQQAFSLGAFGWTLGAFVVGFYLPIGVAFSYLKDPSILARGLFRGGGGGMQLDLGVIRAGAGTVASDLFVEAKSYCFDLSHVEFSNVLSSTLFFLTLTGGVVYLLTALATRRPLTHALAGLFVSLCMLVWFFITPNLVPNSPGIRRSTGVLVGYYAAFSFLLAILWNGESSFINPRVQRAIAWSLVATQIVAGGWTAARNIVDYPQVATDINEDWVMVRANPRDSMEYWFRQCQEGHPFKCQDFGPQCRYAVRFAMVEGQQRWNGREKFPVYGVDPRNGEIRMLELPLWERWEWPH